MKKGDRLSEKQLLKRILDAVKDIADDGADAAKLHNQVAQGKVKYDPDQGDWVCTKGDDED